jgi:hypothetical protein
LGSQAIIRLKERAMSISLSAHLVTGDEDFHGDPALLRFLQEYGVTVTRPADFTLLREQIISGDTL